jgi:hypothetical protein
MKKDRRIVAVLMTLGLMLTIVPAYALVGEASQDSEQASRAVSEASLDVVESIQVAEAVIVPEEEIPQAWTDGHCSVVNLGLAGMSMLLGAGTMAGLFRRKHEERMTGLITAVTAAAVFLVSEDMTQPFCAVDNWTPLMVLILGAAAATAFVPEARKGKRHHR